MYMSALGSPKVHCQNIFYYYSVNILFAFDSAIKKKKIIKDNFSIISRSDIDIV